MSIEGFFMFDAAPSRTSVIAPGCASGAFLEADYVERTVLSSWGGGPYTELFRMVEVRELTEQDLDDGAERLQDIFDEMDAEFGD